MAAPRRRGFPEVLAPERPGGRVAGGGPRAGSLPRAARPLRLPPQQPRPGTAATCRLRRRALGLPLDAAAGSEDATRHRRLPGTPPPLAHTNRESLGVSAGDLDHASADAGGPQAERRAHGRAGSCHTAERRAREGRRGVTFARVLQIWAEYGPTLSVRRCRADLIGVGGGRLAVIRSLAAPRRRTGRGGAVEPRERVSPYRGPGPWGREI